jgi:alpha-L-rhamnosidase
VGWRQRRYELKVDRGGQIEEYHVESEQSTYVTWPSAPLKARERAGLSVRAIGVDNEATPWSQIEIERGLDPLDWRANVTLGPENRPDSVSAQRPYLLRKRFTLEDTSQARLYVTALGLYEVSINGRAVGDHVLAPGWQSYSHRLHYQTFDISDYLRLGDNEISAWIGEGWYAGRLGWAGGRRNIYGADTGLLAQLEVGGRIIARTGEAGWEWSYGRLISSEIYDGEVIDYRIENHTWQPARSTARPSALLLSPEAPPVRRQHTIHPVDLITTPSGKCILDFGQNLVGWLRVRKAPAGRTITIRHAEVLEKGELGTRPLRVCKATDRITTPEGEGSVVINWEPKFTFHGFRYVEIAGWDEVDGGNVEAVVVYSDMERLGDFRCSHEWITKFHQNTVWGLRGNFVSIPTDCPQRDERMGWTGDLQVCATRMSVSDQLRCRSSHRPPVSCTIRPASSAIGLTMLHLSRKTKGECLPLSSRISSPVNQSASLYGPMSPL